jgi:hypothetical protein
MFPTDQSGTTQQSRGRALRQGVTGLATVAVPYARHGLHALDPLHAATGTVGHVRQICAGRAAVR